MAGASGTQPVAAADGRTLTIAECGDPDGFPVFLLHGTPGSRFGGQSLASTYASVGARVITYDRPGYGGSDRSRGRTDVLVPRQHGEWLARNVPDVRGRRR